MVESIVIIKTLFIALSAAITILSEIFFENIKNNIYLALAFISFSLFAIVVVLRHVKATLKQSLEFLLTFSFLFIYQLCRASLSFSNPQIANHFLLNQSEISSFSSLFSLGYAAVQILAGHIISIWGLNGLGILNMLAGISLFFTTIPTNYSSILIIRTISGICFSAGALGFICSANKISKKKFNLLFSVGFFFAVKWASMTTAFLESSSKFHWKSVYKSMGKIAFIIGLSLFALSMFSKKDTTEERNEWGLIKSVKSFISDKDMILLSIFSALIVGPTYIFQNGTLGYFDSFIGKDAGTCTKYFNDSVAYASIAVPVLAAIKGPNLTMVAGGILGSLSSLILLFFFELPYAVVFMILAAVFTAIGYSTHSVPSLFISEKFSDKRVPMYFAIINFICMVFGSAGMQKLSGWINYRFCSSGDLRSLFIFLFLCTISSFTSILIFYIRQKKFPQIKQIEESKPIEIQ